MNRHHQQHSAAADRPRHEPCRRPYADMQRGYMALARFGRADEVAALVAHLAGPETDFITGASLTIDGGYSA